MSFRSWLLVITLGLTLTTSGQAQEEAQSGQREANSEGQQPYEPPLPFPIEIIESPAETEARDSRESEARQREIADLAAQEGMNAATQAMNGATQRMAEYAFWSTVFVAIGTVFLFATIWLTWRAVGDTREIGQKQARAYLVLQFGDVEFNVLDNKDGSNLGVKIGVSLTNSGSTPGYSPIIYYDIQEAVRNDIVPQAQPEAMQSSPISTSFIPAKGKSKTQLSRVWNVDDPIAFQRFKERLVRFSYCVNFLDEFGEDRWTPIISGTFHHWPEGSVSFLPDKLHETPSG